MSPSWSERAVSLLMIPALLVVWQVLALSGLVSPRLLPDLRLVGETLVTETRSGLIPMHAAVTVARAMSGFLLATVAGVLLGYAIARSRILDMLIEPTFVAGYSIPKVTLFPIFTFVFGFGSLAKITFTFLECLYPITLATIFAIRNVERRYIWAAQSMGAGPTRISLRVVLPAAMPGVFSGLRVALPVSVLVVLLTEMLGDSRGLGYYIAISGASFRPDRVFAGIVVAGACGFILDQLLIKCGEWFVPSARFGQMT